MAIFLYADHQSSPDIQKQLSSLAEQTESTRGLLTCLGDYWSAYYQELGTLTQASSGAVASFSRELDRAFETLLSGNIMDFPVEQGRLFDLFVFNKADFETVYDANGEIDSYFVSLQDTNIVYINYLTVNLFESPVILEKDVHFSIDKEKGIYFYVDIFNDPSITDYEYEISDGASQSVLLWGTSVALSSYYIYQRYGRFLYRKAIDSHQYKWIITSLMRFYTNAKSAPNIKKILDILFGIPYARYDNELILEITYTDSDFNDWDPNISTDEAPYIRIVTDKNTYYTYGISELKYGVGDTVPRYELFSEFCNVLDYINSPYWWVSSNDGNGTSMSFPIDMIIADGQDTGLTQQEYYDIMDHVLKYNVVYTQINTTFESYTLYKKILEDIYGIIRSGFPTYIYAFVESIFRIRYNDDYDLRSSASEALYLHLDIAITDEFCRFFKYNGVYKYDGTKFHYMWDCDERMTDCIEFKLSFDFSDKVRVHVDYDGRFLHNGEIMYHAPLSFALDLYTSNIQLSIQEDIIRPEEGTELHIALAEIIDEFCKSFVYNGFHGYNCLRQHDGKDCEERLTDAILANVHCRMADKMILHPHYDGYFEYIGEIAHGPLPMPASDFRHALQALVQFDDKVDAEDEFSAAVHAEMQDEFCARYQYDGKHQYLGYTWHRPYECGERLIDYIEEDMKLQMVNTDSSASTATPLRHNAYTMYDGSHSYDDITEELAADGLVLYAQYSDGTYTAI